MTPLNHPDDTLEKFCNTAIERRLGDISRLPKELVAYVWKVYRDFISGYDSTLLTNACILS